jgi:beta-N-acetylhexosaminidase
LSHPERPRAVIFGCAGPTLAPKERRFFAEVDPLGFILFTRNCRDPDQLASLVAALRDAVERADAPVLIDQEGGRVARLGPPHWRSAPAAARFAALWRGDPAAACEAARANARLMAAELAAAGITVDCAPVLDIPVAGADPIIGDRALGDAPKPIAALGRAVCDGLRAGGVLPVIKHIPGHGRAGADSHKALPVVDTPRAELARTDFAPFRALSDQPIGMTAHVVYRDIDPDRPATTSAQVIGGVIRAEIGFDGFLLSDDVAMGALSGPQGARARDSIEAGCDAVLHCTGVMTEMEEVAAATPPMGDDAARRWGRAMGCLTPPAPCDTAALAARLDALLAGAAVAGARP